MAPGFVIRRADIQDMRAVFELSNDPKVRAHSIHTDLIPWDTHVAWFKRTLTDKEARFFVVVDQEGRLVAQVRFNRRGDAWIVSVSIHASYRGKGLGRGILSAAFREADEGRYVAQIRTDNLASQRLFAALGFEKMDRLVAPEGFSSYEKVIYE